MNINMTGHNVEITDALREFTENKFAKITSHFPRITSINVIFDVQKLEQIAEATINVPNHQIHAKANASDMYSAIDKLMDKLNKQIIKHKEKDSNHHS